WPRVYRTTARAATRPSPARTVRPPRRAGSRGRGPQVSRWGAGLRRLDRLPDLRGRERHVDVPHAERPERVDDRVHVRGGGAAGGGLADALRADRVVRRRGHGLPELEPRRFDGRGKQVVDEVRADAVPGLVERDLLHRGDPVSLGETAVDLT